MYENPYFPAETIMEIRPYRRSAIEGIFPAPVKGNSGQKPHNCDKICKFAAHCRKTR